MVGWLVLGGQTDAEFPAQSAGICATINVIVPIRAHLRNDANHSLGVRGKLGGGSDGVIGGGHLKFPSVDAQDIPRLFQAVNG